MAACADCGADIRGAEPPARAGPGGGYVHQQPAALPQLQPHSKRLVLPLPDVQGRSVLQRGVREWCSLFSVSLLSLLESMEIISKTYGRPNVSLVSLLGSFFIQLS